MDITYSNGNRDVWVIDLARDVPSRISVDAAQDWSAAWSPNGERLVFVSNRGNINQIYEKASTGNGTETLVPTEGAPAIPVYWSPNNDYIVFSRLRNIPPADTTPGSFRLQVIENLNRFWNLNSTNFMHESLLTAAILHSQQTKRAPIKLSFTRSRIRAAESGRSAPRAALSRNGVAMAVSCTTLRSMGSLCQLLSTARTSARAARPRYFKPCSA